MVGLLFSFKRDINFFIELKLRPENTRLDNVPYNDCPNTKQ